MKLSTAKSIQTWSICAAFLVFMLAAFTEYELMRNVFFVISVVFLVSGLIIMLLFWRCPSCHESLGRMDCVGDYCPHCGEKLDFD